MKNNNIRNIYMYLACLICLIVILISIWTFVSSASELIWYDPIDGEGAKGIYQSLFQSTIMLIISIGLFTFHWKHVEK